MCLKYEENLEDLNTKYQLNHKTPKESKIKFGTLTTYTEIDSFYKNELHSDDKKFKIIMIKPKKDNVAFFREFLEELFEFQKNNSKKCPILKIKSIYIERTTNYEKFFIIQKYYNKPLTRKLGRMNEMEVLTFLREICSFYYIMLKNSTSLANIIINPTLGIMPLNIEDISYICKKRKLKFENEFKTYSIKIDLLNFLLKKDEAIGYKLENFHIFEFQKLIFQMLFGIKFEKYQEILSEFNSLKKEIRIAEKDKKIGIFTKNLINCLLNPKVKISWSHIFQHPLLKVDITLAKDKKFMKVWKIDQIRDKKIVVEWIKMNPDYEESKEIEYKDRDEDRDINESDEEKTEKATNIKIQDSFDIIDVSEIKYENIKIYDTEGKNNLGFTEYSLRPEEINIIYSKAKE